MKILRIILKILDKFEELYYGFFTIVFGILFLLLLKHIEENNYYSFCSMISGTLTLMFFKKYWNNK